MREGPWNQLIFGPWIGDGSPVSQMFWIDDPVVASERPRVSSSSLQSGRHTGSNGLEPEHRRTLPARCIEMASSPI